MVEEGRPCPWVLFRPSWNTYLRFGLLMVLILFISCLIYCVLFRRQQQQTQLEPLEVREGEKGEEGRQELKHSGGTGQAREGCAGAQANDTKKRQNRNEMGRKEEGEIDRRQERPSREGRSQLPESARGIPGWERCSLERPG